MGHIASPILFFVLTSMITALNVGAQQRNGSEQPRNTGSELLTTILSHMERAQRYNLEHVRPYTLTRDYKLFDDETQAQNPGQKPSSEVIADVAFMPPDHKSFQIEKSEGSERGTNIVRHILENESAWHGKGPAPLTREYYQFELVGEDTINGQPCWVLAVKPIHDDKNMINGRAWVDKNTYLTQQLQGEMAKTPSWWLKRVDMTIRFGDVAGMWLSTGTYVVAEVRFFGKHVLTSQALKVETSDQFADFFPATRSRQVMNAPGTIKRLQPGVAAGAYLSAR